MSQWKEGAAARRDARHDNRDSSETRMRGKSKKDTKRWCRGKVGVEHQPKCMNAQEAKGSRGMEGWRYLICTTCGRELDIYIPPFGDLTMPVPAWVDK